MAGAMNGAQTADGPICTGVALADLSAAEFLQGCSRALCKDRSPAMWRAINRVAASRGPEFLVALESLWAEHSVLGLAADVIPVGNFIPEGARRGAPSLSQLALLRIRAAPVATVDLARALGIEVATARYYAKQHVAAGVVREVRSTGPSGRIVRFHAVEEGS